MAWILVLVLILLVILIAVSSVASSAAAFKAAEAAAAASSALWMSEAAELLLAVAAFLVAGALVAGVVWLYLRRLPRALPPPPPARPAMPASRYEVLDGQELPRLPGSSSGSPSLYDLELMDRLDEMRYRREQRRRQYEERPW
jgi:hypothetical protein